MWLEGVRGGGGVHVEVMRVGVGGTRFGCLQCLWMLKEQVDILERPGSHTDSVCHCLTDKRFYL